MVTEPDEFFDLMIKIMRDTRDEGMFTLHTVKCDTKSTSDVILIYFLGIFLRPFCCLGARKKTKHSGRGAKSRSVKGIGYFILPHLLCFSYTWFCKLMGLQAQQKIEIVRLVLSNGYDLTAANELRDQYRKAK